MTILHDFGGVLGRPLDTSFWALTISWSRALGSCVKWPLFSVGRAPSLLFLLESPFVQPKCEPWVKPESYCGY